MSIEVGLAIVLLVSVVAEIAMCVYFSTTVRFAAALVIPCIVSASLYWLPNLSRFHDAEFRTWFLLFFMFWAVPSGIACIGAASIFTFVESRNRRKFSSEASEPQRTI